jgi:hypothetical protein
MTKHIVDYLLLGIGVILAVEMVAPAIDKAVPSMASFSRYAVGVAAVLALHQGGLVSLPGKSA